MMWDLIGVKGSVTREWSPIRYFNASVNKMKKNDENKKKQPRNWLAVHAHFRRSWVKNSKKKEASKQECRKFKGEQ